MLVMRSTNVRPSPASSGVTLGEEFWHNMVRPGIALYGAEVNAQLPGIRPAQRLSTFPVRVETIEAGDTVGYGRAFTARRESVIMTVPIGYGDGYHRALGNRAQALLRPYVWHRLRHAVAALSDGHPRYLTNGTT